MNRPALLGNKQALGQALPSAGIEGLERVPIHGARGGAPTGKANGRYRHGERTKQTVKLRREIFELLADARQFVMKLARVST